ncbi:aminotransferase class I/II-fold pyridoxal phosphate-dependent enzyme [Flavihumibacter sp. RY-1]|uniref:Aminotransferase class I/II-fold pyridoxal phosphate-dependent enzyme n=1 Tax=Flavihumibacter fluminis TaxID=2909236 RepID=A0ABS9BMN0_9BACT|nr:aminotransferase class I/II-fold pyridoxal phosphate-dependent enzyme [Flavihumibacter fluminis]MCF1716373.1 aminotransferase class I/II-fold pyridoxal phosphate-dependent enzyme [Flavihumibacter fluminis]
MKKIWLSSPHMGGKEMDFIKEAFDTNWIAPLGPNVDGFEKDVSEYLGNQHVAALSSGTAALHLALILLGVGSEDYVICQSLTFSASANPILYQNATPVFIDSEPDTWNMDPEQLEAGIKYCLSHGKLPKAIIVVHLYGMPAKMREINLVASKYGIPIIEDAAEALGSRFDGIKCGEFGVMSILSFNGNKIITTSGGGALVSRVEDYIVKARFLSTQARDPAPHYEHSSVGYNYRMSNISAGIGRGQMLVLEERIKKRRSIFDFYKSEFSDLESISFQNEDINSFSNRWLTCITVDDKSCKTTNESIRIALNNGNIESRPIWKPMHLQPVFRGFASFLNGTSEYLFKHGLCLPSGSNLDEADLRRISSITKRQFIK